MCRTTDFLGFLPNKLDPNSLKIKAFFIRFSGLKSCKNLPDSLVLVYLPRIYGAELLADGSASFLTLHRVVNVKTTRGEAIFGTREPVQTSGVARFEVLSGDETILKGMLSRDSNNHEEKAECKLELECEFCNLESDVFCGGAADIAVVVDGRRAVLSGRVAIASKTRRKTHKTRRGFNQLEVIPEESSDDGSVSGSEGDDYLDNGVGDDMNMTMDFDLDVEAVQWAVDLGLWVMCLGVGYLVSKASARSLRRLRLL